MFESKYLWKNIFFSQQYEINTNIKTLSFLCWFEMNDMQVNRESYSKEILKTDVENGKKLNMT